MATAWLARASPGKAAAPPVSQPVGPVRVWEAALPPELARRGRVRPEQMALARVALAMAQAVLVTATSQRWTRSA